MNSRPVCLYYGMLKYQPENLALLRQSFECIELSDPSQDTSEILDRVEVLFAPLGYQVDKAKIDACPRLKVVASNTTGHPHIDVDYCRAKGIEVACLKFVPEFLRSITPTAELTFGLIIALTRGLIPAQRAALEGHWDRRPHGAPAMLSRMKLGIVGLGRLGGWVSGYGRAFGMEVAYFDPYVDDAEVRRFGELGALAAWCDVLSIHAPHENETEKLVSTDVIARLRRGSYLVNTARGELLDWAAVLAALQDGRLAGAAFDVFEGEFEPGFADRYPEHPLLAYAQVHDNVILTPHIGGSTRDAWAETERKTIEMALAALAAA
jgi:D-3-phosphoglycerate dehydrogenase